MNTFLSVSLLPILLLLANIASGQQCSSDTDRPQFTRMFLGTFKGSISCCGNETSMRKALGECGHGLDSLAQAMAKYIQSGYGIDLSPVKDNPYVPYRDSRLSFVPIMTHSESDVDMIITETFYEYASSLKTPMVIVGWGISVEETSSGYLGEIRPGQRLIFFNSRFRTSGGAEFCMLSHTKSPDVRPEKHGVRALNLVVYNEYWGNGTLRGVSIDSGDVSDQTYIIAFPA